MTGLSIIQIAVVVVILIILALGGIYYLTRDKEPQPFDEKGRTDPDYKNISPTQVVSVFHAGYGKNFILAGGTPQKPDKAGNFNALWYSDDGETFEGNTANLRENLGIASFFGGEHSYTYYPLGPKKGIEQELKEAKEIITDQDETIAYYKSRLKELGEDVEDQIQQEMEKQGARKAARSTQGYSRLPDPAGGFKKGKKKNQTTTTTTSDEDDYYGGS